MRTTKKLATLILLCTATWPALAFEKNVLTVWIGQDKGFKGLAEIGQRFTADSGMPVKVATPDDLPGQYDKFAATAKGPDIVIFAHDRFGSWINNGLLEAVQPSAEALQRAPGFAWEALTVGTQRFGYPLATEVVSLIYNRRLLANPPRTLSEVTALDGRLRAQGRRAIAWDYNNLYFSWPIIAGAGGYSLRKQGGIYDLADVGVATPGAIAGMQALKQLLDDGVLEPGDDYASALEGFKQGRIAMIVNGPWVWNELRDAGLDFAIDHVPGIDETRRGRPFVGILAAAINANSPHKAQARRFVEDYLSSAEGLHSLNADKPLGAVANHEVMAQLRHDPLIDHTYESAASGEIMPDIPEMKRFWALFSSRLGAMFKGEKPIAATLEQIAQRLRAAGEVQAWRRRHYPAADSTAGSL
ncbi:maltose/maltodextrin ABC transporter substrate-binding protein MalE [Ectopseudomonas chengduensis]|nr:maltose/maltodextrin ABC transporter substrate-binding protein MalE [Pseudomonas sp. WS 5019]NMY18317.1 maltose/maltodextrin ABC transporter substrate-binding protein MalE [Pseudomonas sp. WS 5019]